MKRTLLIIATLFVVLTSGMAQNHIVKLGIPSLLYGRANLNYEFVLNDKTSLNLRAGAQFPRNFPVDAVLQEDPNDEFRINSGKWNAYGFTPSYRIYFGKNNPAPQGFYVSPYVSYNKNTVTVDMEYDDGAQISVPATMKVGYSGIGGGVMIGNQWVINESFVIDFNYFGIGYGLQTIAMKFSSSDPSVDYDQLKDELEAELENTGNNGVNDIDNIEALDDGIKIKAEAPSPQVKFSFSLGYMF